MSEKGGRPIDSTSHTEAEKSRKVRHLTLFLWVGGLVIVALAGIGATAPLWTPRISAYFTGGEEDSYQVLVGRVKALEDEARPGPDGKCF